MRKDETRDALVLAAVPHAAFDGWSAASLEMAAAELGLPAGEAARLLPGGAAEAVAVFVAIADRLMAADLAAANPAAMRTGERVFTAVKLRLERWAAAKESVRRALALLALPRHLGLAARLTWRTADAVWAACGDTSTDLSRYTKRATLAAVYSATLLYWLDDPSEDSAATWDFLRRRLGDIQRLPKLTAAALPIRRAAGPWRRGPRSGAG